ncbi:MAG: hypothetical protein ACR2OU_09525 [Thermomicrobiales bacterium]
MTWMPRARRLCRATLALSAVLLTGCQAQTDASGRTVLATPTLGQMLGVSSASRTQPGAAYTIPVASGVVQDQRVVEGRTVQIVRAGTTHHVVVDGRVLASDTEDDRVLIQGVHQGSGRTYVLIAEQSGGNACPSLYQAIDLSGGAAVISPQFGNCSDLPRISVSGGALRVSVPAFRAARAATYMFRDGRLS